MTPESRVVLAHGLRLVGSTLREDDQAFRCRVLEANVWEKETQTYRVMSDGFEAVTNLEAQTGAYNFVTRSYPAFADQMKKLTVFDLAWSDEELVSLGQGKDGKRMRTNEECWDERR